jgi:chromatin structure-remodeling complex subunit RSC4
MRLQQHQSSSIIIIKKNSPSKKIKIKIIEATKKMVKRKGSISNTSNSSKKHQSDHFSKILSRLESLPNSEAILSAFRELPSKAVVPDYYDIIKKPISITEIEKAAVKATDELEVIYKSFKLMRENARTYNDSRSEIAINAGIILKVVGDYILEIVLGKSSKSFIDAFNRRQLQIIDELMRLKASRRNIAELFLDEPSKELYPDYYQLISTPTSLNTVRAKVLAGELRTIESFRQAVELIFTNAYTYNSPTSQVYVDAQTLEKHFNNQVEKLKLPAEPTKYQENATKLMNGECPLPAAETHSETPKIGTLKLKLKTPVSKETPKEPTKEAPKLKLNLKEPEKIKIKLSHKKEEAVQKLVEETDVDIKLATVNEVTFTEDRPAEEPQATVNPSVEESKMEPTEEVSAVKEPVEIPGSEPKLDTAEDAPETEATESQAVEPEDVVESQYNPEESLFQHIIINPVIPITSKYHLYKSPPPAGLLNLFQVNFLPSQKKSVQSFALTVPAFHNTITLNATIRETLHSQPYDLVLSHNYKKLEPFTSSTDSKWVDPSSPITSRYELQLAVGLNMVDVTVSSGQFTEKVSLWITLGK